MISKPSKWTGALTSVDIDHQFNRRTEQIFAALQTGSPADLSSICRDHQELGVLTLATGQNRVLNLLHHFGSVGSTLAGTQVVSVALSGEQATAQPFVLSEEALFETEQVNVPSKPYLVNLASPEDVARPLPNDGSVPSAEKSISHSILLPPWAAHAIIEAGAFSPMEAFIAILETARSLDTVTAEAADQEQQDDEEENENGDPTQANGANGGQAGAAEAAVIRPSFVSQAILCLQTLWRWSQVVNPVNGEVAPVIVDNATMPTRRQDVLDWAARLHTNCLAAGPRVPLSPDSNAGPSSGALNAVASELATAATALERASKRDTDNRVAQQPGFSRLPEASQKMILRAMSSDGASFPGEAPDHTVEFFKQRSAAQAYQYVADALAAKNLRCEPSQGLVSAVHQGFILARRKGIPGNLTPFGLPKTFKRLKLHSAEDDVAAAMRISEGKGSTEADIDRQSKQNLHFPEDLEDAKHQLANTIGMLELFAPLAQANDEPTILISQLLTLYKHMQRFPETYEELDANRPTFLSEITFLYGDAIQNFYQSCREGLVDSNLVCFTSILQQVRQRTFALQLPQEVLTRFNLQHPRGIKPTKTKGGGGGGGGGGGEGNQRRELFPNPWHADDRSKEFKLQDGEDYSRLVTDVIHAKLASPPMWSGDKQNCVKFHVTGVCVVDCPRKEAHKKPNQNQEGDLTRFMRECRDLAAAGNVPVSKRRKRRGGRRDF